MGASRRALGLLLVALVSTACGDDKKPSAAPSGNGGSGNGGNTRDDDAGPLSDAGAGDAGDAGQTPVVDIECEIEGGAPLSFDARRAPDGAAFSVSVQGNTAHLVIATKACGTTHQALSYVKFDTTGDASDPVVLAGSDIDCWSAREPVVLTSDTGAAWLYYTANPFGLYTSLELHRKNLISEDEPELLGTNNDNELFLSGAQINKGDLPFFVYANTSTATRDPTAVSMGSRRVGKIESLLLKADDGFHPSQTAVGSYGREGEKSLGVVAWLSDLEPDSVGVYLRTTDEEGKAAGDIVQLNGDVETEILGGAGNVDLAGQTVGGAVVYTVKPATFQEVRFRAIDENGEVGERVNLTRGQQNVRDVSIAPYAKGYVVAYRRVGGQAGVMGSLELIFVDDAGRVGGTRRVGEATSDGRGVKVLVANDGRLVLVWQDTDGEGAKVRAARLKCSN